MKQILEEIINRNTEGNYLLSKSDKAKIISEILDLLGVTPLLPIDKWDAEDFLLTKGISNHPQIQDSVTGNNNYEVADLIAEYANSFFRQ